MPKSSMARRTFLRGLLAGTGVALALPALEIMLDANGIAYADGSGTPKRFGTWFFGNGVVPVKWNPGREGQGSAWQLSQQLQPLARHKSVLSVATGFELKTDSGIPHASGPSGALTGALHDDSKTVRLPSIDQVIADRLAADTPYRSLEVGVSRAAPFDTGTVFYAISHRGPDAPNYPEFDPHALYDRLFGLQGGSPSDRAIGRSVLDAVLTDFNALEGRVGASDRRRLQQHAEGIRSLERRLDGVERSCTIPVDPRQSHPGVVADRKEQAPPELNALMAELLALALACDMTRVFSFLFTYPAAQVFLRHLGRDFDTAFHDNIVHAGDERDSNGQITRGVRYAMESFAVLLDRLAELPEGDGSVLDHTLIYATSCTGRGWDHDPMDYPILFAGTGCGAFRGDVHVRSRSRESVSKALFTAAEACGLRPTTYGLDEGRVTSGISAFLG